MDWKSLKSNSVGWDIFRLRAKIVSRIREFFSRERFLSVETPLLSPALIPESYLEVFETELADKLGRKKKAYLTPSPEMWHKKLLAGGSGNIFEITKSFRNTDIGGHFHNPEFTLLEWYRVGADYRKTMVDCERLIRFINEGKSKLSYQGKVIDIGSPFLRLSVLEAFSRYAGIGKEILFDRKRLCSLLLKRKYQVSRNDDWETLYNLCFLKEVEPNLGTEKPTFIYDFPAQFASLAKTGKDPRFKERFELYLFGVELADAYSELTDAKEQKARFRKEEELRVKLGKTTHPSDGDFIKALELGLPLCSGVALGVDRLVMVFANAKDIGEVMFFSGGEIFSF